jgi:hypothetical protein
MTGYKDCHAEHATKIAVLEANVANTNARLEDIVATTHDTNRKVDDLLVLVANHNKPTH